MDSSKNSTTLAILSLLIAAVILICYWEPSGSNSLFSMPKRHSNHSNEKDELQIVLEKASWRADRTVIITIINEAYVQPRDSEYPAMFDLFLEGFWTGDGIRPLVDRLLVVAMDETAYKRCVFRRLNCYKLSAPVEDDFAGEKIYMTEAFIRMMWRRTGFLLDVLKRGYSFVFTDTDIVWLRNPFTRGLSRNLSVDLQISTDSFNGDPYSQANPVNTGFYFIRSNNRTIALFQGWYERRSNSTGKKEQDVLIEMMNEGVLGKLALETRFLPTLHFSGFCSDSRDVRQVVTVHANCCRTIGAKVADLKVVLREWKRFQEMHRNGTAGGGFRWSRHVACANSWA